LDKHAAKLAAIKAGGGKASGLTWRTGGSLRLTGKELLKELIAGKGKSGIKSFLKSGFYTVAGFKSMKAFLKEISPIDQLDK